MHENEPLSEAGEDLQFLTSLPGRGAGVRVTGRVNEWGRHPAEEYGADYGPLKGIVVSIRGATFSRDLVTDERGTYELSGVPPGKLTIAVAAPSGLGADVAGEFEPKHPGGCIQADVTFAAEAVVTGSVQDLNGRPLGGITIDAVAEELAGFHPPAYQSPVKTDEYGVFRFERLPPGRYVFGVNLTTQQGKPPSGPAIFFPGTSSVQGATVVELKPGDRKDVSVVRLRVH